MKRIICLEVILLATLVGCIPGSQSRTSAQETSPGGAKDSKPQQGIPTQGIRPNIKFNPEILTSLVNGEQLIKSEEGNCPVDEIEIPGEKARVAGSTGGFVIAPNPVGKNGTPIPTGNPLETSKKMFDAAEPSFNEPTAIIVVDDFNGGVRQPSVYFLDQQDAPTLADLKSGATEADVAQLEADRQYSHGALVFNHTLALLSAEDPNPELSEIRIPVPDREEVISVPILTSTRLNIVVVPLDTQNFNTDIIGGRLQATINTLARQQIRRFAVNLSFGLVPCSVRDDFRAANDAELTFEGYRDEVLDANGLDVKKFRDDLANILTTPVNIDNDPLLAVAETNLELSGAADITYLAASGNYRLPYSLYPGYWPEFVSVSAQNLANTSAPAVRDPDYSDTGEVLMPGGYFMLTAYDPNTGGFRTYPQISIAGTSFSAPVLSVFTALDFTGATPRCTRRPPSLTSPLAFFNTDVPVSPAPALNVGLEDALNKYCP